MTELKKQQIKNDINHHFCDEMGRSVSQVKFREFDIWVDVKLTTSLTRAVIEYLKCEGYSIIGIFPELEIVVFNKEL